MVVSLYSRATILIAEFGAWMLLCIVVAVKSSNSYSSTRREKMALHCPAKSPRQLLLVAEGDQSRARWRKEELGNPYTAPSSVLGTAR